MFSDDETADETSSVWPNQLKVDSDTEQAKLKYPGLRFQSVEDCGISQLQMKGSQGLTRKEINSNILGNSVVYTDLKSPETKTNESPEQHIQPLLEQNKSALTKSANLGLPETNWKSSLGTYNLSKGNEGFKDGPKLVSSNTIGIGSSCASSEKPFNGFQSRIGITDFNKLTKSGTMAIGETGMPLSNNFSNDTRGGSLILSSSNSQAHKHASNETGGLDRNINEDFMVKHSNSIVSPTSTSPFQPSTTKISSNGGPDVSPRIEALPSIRKSQLLFQQQNISDNEFQSLNNRTKPFQGKLTTDANLSKGSANVKFRLLSYLGLPTMLSVCLQSHSSLIASVFFGFQIREMTEQLDKLLKDLEGTGGFVDPSTGLANPVEGFSNCLEALACKCKTWKVVYVYLLT